MKARASAWLISGGSCGSQLDGGQPAQAAAVFVCVCAPAVARALTTTRELTGNASGLTLRPTSPPAQPPVKPPSSLSCVAAQVSLRWHQWRSAASPSAQHPPNKKHTRTREQLLPRAAHREHLLVALDEASLADVDVVRAAALLATSAHISPRHTCALRAGGRLRGGFGRPLLERLLAAGPTAGEATRVAALQENTERHIHSQHHPCAQGSAQTHVRATSWRFSRRGAVRHETRVTW